jgi:hypothetical protein
MRSIEHIVHNRCMDVKPLPRYTITCESDGKTHKGTYWVAGKILTVSTGLGGKANRLVLRSLKPWQNNSCSSWSRQVRRNPFV